MIPIDWNTKLSEAVDLLQRCQKLFEQGAVDRGWSDKTNWIDNLSDDLYDFLESINENHSRPDDA